MTINLTVKNSKETKFMFFWTESTQLDETLGATQGPEGFHEFLVY
jgi:hypothetical protein